MSASIAGRLPASGVSPTSQAPTSPSRLVLSVRAAARCTPWRRGSRPPEERVDVVQALSPLGEDGDRGALLDAAELELRSAHLQESRAATRLSSLIFVELLNVACNVAGRAASATQQLLQPGDHVEQGVEVHARFGRPPARAGGRGPRWRRCRSRRARTGSRRCRRPTTRRSSRRPAAPPTRSRTPLSRVSWRWTPKGRPSAGDRRAQRADLARHGRRRWCRPASARPPRPRPAAPRAPPRGRVDLALERTAERDADRGGHAHAGRTRASDHARRRRSERGRHVGVQRCAG